MVSGSPKHRPAFLCASAVIFPFAHLAPVPGDRAGSYSMRWLQRAQQTGCPGADLDAIVAQTVAIMLIESSSVFMQTVYVYAVHPTEMLFCSRQSWHFGGIYQHSL